MTPVGGRSIIVLPGSTETTALEVPMRSQHPAALVFFAAIALVLVPAAIEAQEPDFDWKEGPGDFELGRGVATVSLGEGFVFAGPKDTRKIMELMGNPPSGQEAGLVMPTAENKNWFLIFEYNPVGYVSDDDSHTIDADAILDGIRRGTEQSNKARKKQGFPTLEVLGWYENPSYDRRTNNLVWALEGRDEGGESFVNYNTRLLGRSGFMSVTLVTDSHTLTMDKASVEAVLAGFSYNQGSRYMDFVPGDEMAGYGVAALVAGGAGVAAAKLGLFAVLGKFLAKMWKLVIVGVAALGAGIKRLFSSSESVSEY